MRDGALNESNRVVLARHIRVAVWFGVVLGLGETAALAVRAFVFGGVNRVTPQVVWMAPVVYASSFGVVALILFASSKSRRRLHHRFGLHGVLIFLSAVAILALPGLLHPAAIVVVAAGAAFRATTWVREHGEAFDRIVGASLRSLIASVLLVTLVLNGMVWVRERLALRRWPAGNPDAPNVIVIVWDTVRAASLGLYGFVVPTPNLERLARQGVTFETALASTSWTLPSHASMFTGRPPNQLSATWFAPLDDKWPTLAEIFSQHGYRTGGFVSNLLYTTREFGLGRGFMHYEDYRISIGQAVLSTTLGRLAFDASIGDSREGLVQELIGRPFLPGRKTAVHVNQTLLEWIDDDPDRPYFAFLNYFDAHLPYDAPPRIRRQFLPVDSAPPFIDRLRNLIGRPSGDTIPEASVLSMKASYHAAIAWLDEQLGVLIEELDERGQLDNTIIVVTSDHGEEFREHGQLEHGTNLYFWQLRVPLLIAAEGRVPPGVRVKEPVSLADLPATITRWLPGQPAPFPGTPLQVTWSDTIGGAQPLPPVAELSPGRNRNRVIRSIADDSLYLVRRIDGEIEVYDIISDPFQAEALTGISAPASRLERLLDQRIRCEDPGCGRAMSAAGRMSGSGLLALPRRPWPARPAAPGFRPAPPSHGAGPADSRRRQGTLRWIPSRGT
jgi:arylsulfatase A-like enzyme